MNSLTTVSMVSGGKTSAYMALNYPTDRYLFSPVLALDKYSRIEDDSLRNYCQNKIKWFDWSRYGSLELEQTLANLRRLEDELEAEIEWVAAPFTYDQLIENNLGDYAIAFGQANSKSPMLPNRRIRVCTEALKVYPAAWHLYLTGDGNPYVVNMGFRADESRRVNRWKCDLTNMTLHCDIDGQFKGKHRHSKLDYRFVKFPLFSAGINQLNVMRFWYKKGWEFPKISNCSYCFFHTAEQQRLQHSMHPNKRHWWEEWEKKVDANFGDRPLTQILDGTPIEEQLDGPLFSCMCTD